MSLSQKVLIRCDPKWYIAASPRAYSSSQPWNRILCVLSLALVFPRYRLSKLNLCRIYFGSYKWRWPFYFRNLSPFSRLIRRKFDQCLFLWLENIRMKNISWNYEKNFSNAFIKQTCFHIEIKVLSNQLEHNSRTIYWLCTILIYLCRFVFHPIISFFFFLWRHWATSRAPRNKLINFYSFTSRLLWQLSEWHSEIMGDHFSLFSAHFVCKTFLDCFVFVFRYVHVGSLRKRRCMLRFALLALKFFSSDSRYKEHFTIIILNTLRAYSLLCA